MNMKIRLSTALLYPIGDGVAQLILHEFSIGRFFSLAFLACVFYSWEIPRWFKILDTAVLSPKGRVTLFIPSFALTTDHTLNWLGRTLGALLYFNPLWIARHMFFVSLGKAHFFGLTNVNELIIPSLLLGTQSFIINLPVSILGNFIVQAKLKCKYRFLGSVVLTSLFAICYALLYRFL